MVNSYLKWLEDSDYDAVCILCAHSLQNGPVVRLICYGMYVLINSHLAIGFVLAM